MTQSGLKIAHLSVERGRTQVLADVTVAIDSGQIVAVIGPNGAGKSTLLAAVAGHLPFTGKIRLDGRPIAAGRAGYMPQATEVHAGLSVLETVLLGRFDRLGWRIDRRDLDAAERALAALDLGSLTGRRLATLSGGQRQLVLLAQRLVRTPRLLILDEATSALDLRHQLQVLDYLRRYVEATGALVLMAIHDLNLAARHADRMLLIANRKLVVDGGRNVVVTADTMRSCFGIEAEILRTSTGHPVVVPVGPAGIGLPARAPA